jgi:ribose transport system permease protein
MLLGLVSLVYTGLTDSAAFTTRPEGLDTLRSGSLGDVCAAGTCGPPAIPVMLLVTIAVMAALWFAFARMRVGRELLVLGSNERAARLSGVATRRRILLAHLLSGLLAGLAGFMLAATTGSFKAEIGDEFLLPSFLGPVLGGTLLTGGFVSVLGTFLGTALTSVIRQGLVLLEVGLENLNIYLGIILLLAISTERLRAALSRVLPAGPAGGAAAAQELRGAPGRRRFRSSGEATLLAIAVAGLALLAIKSDGNLLLDGNARRTFLAFLSVPVLIGLAQLAVLAVGQMNLAVGALGGLVAVATASLMADAGVSLALAVPMALALGAAAGVANGAIVVATRVNGFIVTLATMTICLGVQYRIVGTSTIGGYSGALRSFGDATIASVPLTFLVTLAVAGALAFFFGRTVAGRHLLATGGNPLAARLSGISNDRSIVTAHALSGLIVAVAALVTMASLDNVNASIGGDWLLPSFAAPIIGGVLLTGGSVSVAGTVLAAVIIRLVDTGRAEFSLDPSWVSFVVGAVVLGTVLAGRARQATQRRAARHQGAVA